MAYTIEQLLQMPQADLDKLFTESPAGPIPSGEADGTAIVAPGTTYSPTIAKFVSTFAWQGKVFDFEKGVLRNRILPFGLNAIIALAPFLVIASPVLLFLLRSHETSDPEITPRVPRERVSELAAQEDHDFTNQFSAMGDVKPGWFRRWLVVALLNLLDYASRHIYRRGYLSRVQTIHFARWVLLDDNRRLLFASSYDGSLESYMDDFINKVAWGINVVFGNGVGFPRISWLFLGGAEFEGKYKRYLGRHQIPTQVWYKAYPGLSVADLNRNTLIRQGVEHPPEGQAATMAWLSLL